MYEYSKRGGTSQSFAKEPNKNVRKPASSTRRAPLPKPVRHFPGRSGGHISSAEEDSDESDKEAEEVDQIAGESEEEEAKPIKKPIEVKIKSSFTKVETPKPSISTRKPITMPKSPEESEEEEEESSDEESEEEEDDEDEEEESSDDEPQFVPTFVSKDKRTGISATIKASKSQESILTDTKSESGPNKSTEESQADKEQKRKERVLELAEETIRREIAHEQAHKIEYRDDNEIFQVDDTDDIDPEAEHAAWKLRELKRVQRERQEIEEIEREKEERELQKDKSDEISKGSRFDDFDKRKSAQSGTEESETKPKEHWKIKRHAEKTDGADETDNKKGNYMQRFYHKGAFYQDLDVLKNRDFTEAVEDDYKNKDILPEYLQTRGQNIGLKGRTKYRSMKEEDSTRGVDPIWKKPRFDNGKDAGRYERRVERPDSRDSRERHTDRRRESGRDSRDTESQSGQGQSRRGDHKKGGKEDKDEQNDRTHRDDRRNRDELSY